MDYNVDNIERKPEINPTANTDIILHKDGKFQRAKIFGANGKIKQAFVDAVINQTINNNTYELDPEQIVPSEALYNNPAETLAGDIIKRVDINTGENVNYRETTTWHDGSAMDDSKVDGVIFIKVDSKYYKRQYEDFINVKWFGVKGDGITDDTSAIQRAFDFIFEARNYGIKVIFFPEGIYKITADLISPSQCEIVGAFKNSTVIFQTSRLNNAFVVKENRTTPNERITAQDTVFRNITIRSLLYDKNAFGWFDHTQISSNNNNSGIIFNSIVRTHLQNVNIEGFETAGVFYNNSYYHKFDNIFVRFNKIGLLATGTCTSIFGLNSEFRFNAQGHRLIDSYACKFSNCLLESNHTNYLNPIDFNSQTDSSAGMAVLLEGSSRITYSNCYFEAHNVTAYIKNSECIVFENNFISSGSHNSIYPQTPSDGFSFLLINSINNSFINNDHYTAPVFEDGTRYYFTSTSKNNRIVLKTEKEFLECIEHSIGIDSFVNKDESPRIECPNIGVMSINSKKQSMHFGAFLGDSTFAPKIYGANAIMTDKNYDFAFYDGSSYLTPELNVTGVKRKGTTAERPNANTVDDGFSYYDKTIKKMLYADNANNIWLDAIGNIVV